MKYSRRLVTIKSLIKRGLDNCVICDSPVDIENARIVIDGPRRIEFMRLRHTRCVRSKYRPVQGPRVLEILVEKMIASPFKLCGICKKSWIGSELDDLLVARGDVIHAACARA